MYDGVHDTCAESSVVVAVYCFSSNHEMETTGWFSRAVIKTRSIKSMVRIVLGETIWAQLLLAAVLYEVFVFYLFLVKTKATLMFCFTKSERAFETTILLVL